EAQNLRQRMGEGRLADTGNVLDQQVPACQQTGQADPDLLWLAENHRLQRIDGRLQPLRARLRCGCCVHGWSNPRRRSSWAPRPVIVRSSSASRSRSLATTSAGALRTKLSLESRARIFARSWFDFASTLLSRSISAATSIKPAIGTNRVRSPTMAVAACGTPAPGSSTVILSRAASRSR